MNNTTLALLFYILGMAVYFIGIMTSSEKPLIEVAHEANEIPELVSDRTLLIVSVIILFFSSFVWPINVLKDIFKELKGVMKR